MNDLNPPDSQELMVKIGAPASVFGVTAESP